ncbi:MAG: hypothetical protein J6A28_04955 [Clostridia bacterium]|nr:hypothetical protein [Clostridia bacterium]
MANTTINNKIIKNGQTINQPVTLIENGDKLLSYALGADEFFAIEKSGSKYKLTFTPFGKSQLKLPADIGEITLDDRAVSLLPKKVDKKTTIGQEIELSVSINGNQSTLKANAESVSLVGSQSTYIYQAQAGQGLGINISQQAIAMAFGQGKLFANAPTAYNADFLLPLLRVVMPSLPNKSGSIKIGNFTLHTIKSSQDTPNLLIQPNGGTPYLFSGSVFHAISTFIPLHDNGKPYLCIDGAGLKQRGLELPTQGNNLTAKAKEIIDIISNHATLQYDTKTSETEEQARKAAGKTFQTNKGDLFFESKDTRILYEITRDFTGSKYALDREKTAQPVNANPEIIQQLQDVGIALNNIRTEQEKIVIAIDKNTQLTEQQINRIIQTINTSNANIQVTGNDESMQRLRLNTASLSSQLKDFSVQEANNRTIFQISEWSKNISDNNIIRLLRSFVANMQAQQKKLEAFAAKDPKRDADYNAHNAYMINAFKDIEKTYAELTALNIRDGETLALDMLLKNYKERLNTYNKNFAASKPAPTPERDFSTFNLVEIIQEGDVYIAELNNRYASDAAITASLDNISNALSGIQNILTELDRNPANTTELLATFNQHITNLNTSITQINSLNISAEEKEALKSLGESAREKGKEKEQEAKGKYEEHVEKEKKAEEERKEKEKKEQEEKEKKEKAAKKAPKAKEYDWKKQVETASTSLMALAGILAVGILIPGLGGLFVALSIATMATAVVTKVYSDKFKFKIYEDANRELTAAEKEEAEDAEAIEKFLENEKTLDQNQEKVSELAAKVRKEMENESSPIHEISNVYEQHGIGFNITSNDSQTRVDQLLGLDGHNIRESMADGLELIASSPDATRNTAVRTFIRQHFSQDMPEEDRKKLEMALTNRNNFDTFRTFAASISALNEEEKNLLDTMTKGQKVDVGTMPERRLGKLLSSPMSWQEREKILERYGSTILKRFALQNTISQEKIENLFKGLTEEEKTLATRKMQEIGGHMQDQMDAIKSLADEIGVKNEQLNNISAYATVLDTLQPDFNISSLSELEASSTEYLQLQSFKTNQMLAEKTMQQIGTPVRPKDRIVLNAATSATGAEVLQSSIRQTYIDIINMAKEQGILDDLAKQFALTPELTAKITTNPLSADSKTIEKIAAIATSKPEKPEYSTLAANIQTLANQRKELSVVDIKNFCQAIEASITPSFLNTFNNSAERQYNKAMTENSQDTSPYAQEFKAFAGRKEAIVTAIKCKMILAHNLSCATNKNIKEHYQYCQKIYANILDGSIAEMQMANLENESMGLSDDAVAVIDGEIANAATGLESNVDGYRNMENSIYGLFTPKTRQLLKENINVRLNIGEANIDSLQQSYGAFVTAWGQALNGNLTELERFLQEPATEEAKAAYAEKISDLEKMGINVKELKKKFVDLDIDRTKQDLAKLVTHDNFKFAADHESVDTIISLLTNVNPVTGKTNKTKTSYNSLMTELQGLGIDVPLIIRNSAQIAPLLKEINQERSKESVEKLKDIAEFKHLVERNNTEDKITTNTAEVIALMTPPSSSAPENADTIAYNKRMEALTLAGVNPEEIKNEIKKLKTKTNFKKLSSVHGFKKHVDDVNIEAILRLLTIPDESAPASQKEKYRKLEQTLKNNGINLNALRKELQEFNKRYAIHQLEESLLNPQHSSTFSEYDDVAREVQSTIGQKGYAALANLLTPPTGKKVSPAETAEYNRRSRALSTAGVDVELLRLHPELIKPVLESIEKDRQDKANGITPATPITVDQKQWEIVANLNTTEAAMHYTTLGNQLISDESQRTEFYTIVKEELKKLFGTMKIDQVDRTADVVIKNCTENGVFDIKKFFAYLENHHADFNTRNDLELSCITRDLGTNYTEELLSTFLGNEDQRKEISFMQSTNDQFVQAWEKASKNGDFDELRKLLAQPDSNASNKEKIAYQDKIKMLESFGIDVKEIQDNLTQLDTKSAAEPTKADAAVEATKQAFSKIEKVSGYSQLGKEAIGAKFVELEEAINMSKAESNADRQYIEALSRADRAASDATTFMEKYKAIASLQGKKIGHKALTEKDVKNILRNFASGERNKIVDIPALQGLMFSRKDVELIQRIGLSEKSLTTLSTQEVTKHVRNFVTKETEQLRKLERKEDKKSAGKTSANLEESRKPSQVKNKISILCQIFANMEVKNEIEKEQKRKELEAEFGREYVENAENIVENSHEHENEA